MDPSTPRVGGRVSSSQVDDAATRLLRGLCIGPNEVGHGVTPLSLAIQSTLPYMAQNMRAMEEKHNDPIRQRFQIPLKTAFKTAMQSFGFTDPVFSVVQHRDCFQFTISLSKCSRTTHVEGGLSQSREVAEETAIKNALNGLRRLENVVLVDISDKKEKALIQTSRAYYFKTLSLFQQVHYMIINWSKCRDSLASHVDFANHILRERNVVNKQLVDSIYNHLLLIRGASTVHIDSLEASFRSLCYEKARYAAASRAQSFNMSQVAPKKAYFPDVDALALLINWIGLPECKYSEELADNRKYVGSVLFTLPSLDPDVPPRNVLIFAKDHKKTITKAHNAAAREGIYYLEGQFNVEVAGFNHLKTVLADQETYVWKGLNEEILMFGQAVLRFWTQIVKKLVDCIGEHKDSHKELLKTLLLDDQIGDMEDESVLLDGLFRRLDVAAANWDKSLKVAAKKFGSTN